MSQKLYAVELTRAERGRLREIVDYNGRMGRRKRTRAQVLLKIDQGEHGPGWTDAKASEAFDMTIRAIEKLRKRLVEEGFEQILKHKNTSEPPRKQIFNTKGEKQVLALAEGEAPNGRVRWTLRLLADEIVRLEIADSVSHETVRKVLKKGICSRTDRWVG